MEMRNFDRRWKAFLKEDEEPVLLPSGMI
jgi:hypothetical protein